jgi:hypothetical protein
MDWTYKLFGIDLSYVWDPELWVRFKEAVARDTPALFWNKLWDRCGRACGAGVPAERGRVGPTVVRRCSLLWCAGAA